MFSKKKRQEEQKTDSRIIIGMIMLNDDNSIDTKLFRKDFKKNFDNSIDGLSGDNAAFAFNVDNEGIAVGHIPMPIPHGDIEGTAEYAYNWETALEDLKNHKSHLIVTIMNGGQDQVKRFKIFTKVICSLLRTTNSIGVYEGSQSLLIPKQDYLHIAEGMTDDYFPLNLWIYFGYRKTEKGNSGYTYGLKEFGKHEMEIVESTKTIGEIEKFLYNMTHYVLEYDVAFKDGQTCGMSVDERIAITFSKGKFVDTETFKLAY
jgi:hypothetical protein